MNRQMIEQFYKHSYRLLIKRTYAHVKNPHAAEDIVQEAFCRALKYHDEDVGNFRNWFSVLLNNARMDFQRAERMGGASLEFDEEWEAVGMSDWADDMLNKIGIEIEKVEDEELRSAYHLYYIKQYKPREILQVVQLTPGKLRVCIHRFGEKLKEKFS